MLLSLSFDGIRNTWSVRRDGYLFVLARDKHELGTTQEREYMVIARLGKHPNGYLVEPVTEDHMLVEHDGFECSGSMCRTLAYPLSENIAFSYITPGRVEPLLHIANNVNLTWSMPLYGQDELDHYKNRGDWTEANWKANDQYRAELGRGIIGWYKVPAVKPVPGKVYIRKGERRATGLPSAPARVPLPDERPQRCTRFG